MSNSIKKVGKEMSIFGEVDDNSLKEFESRMVTTTKESCVSL